MLTTPSFAPPFTRSWRIGQILILLSLALLGFALQSTSARATPLTLEPCVALAGDEASLTQAINCINSADAGTHHISITQSISLTQPLPTLRNPIATQVVIEGHGYTLDANGSGRVLNIELTHVLIRQLTLRGGRVPLADNVNGSGGALQLNGGRGESGCSLLLEDSVIEDNEASNGGAIANHCDASLLTIRNSTIRNNYALLGGAIYIPTAEELFSEMVIQASNITDNHAEAQGGGIYLRGGDAGSNVTILDSLIANNTVVNGPGGGISVRTGEPAITNLLLQRVAIIGNQAATGAGLHILSGGATHVTVGNSTISSNQAISGTGGGMWIQGIFPYDATDVRVINSTIAQNSATTGGGLYQLDGLLTLTNTIVAANTTGGDCQLGNSPGAPNRYQSGGHNLDSDGTCLSLAVRQPSDIPNGNAQLGSLADNGGSAPTHALLPGSAAIDTGDDSVCAAAPIHNVDQRGEVRPQHTHCDIGAYEARVEPQSSTNLRFVSSRSSGRAGTLFFRDEDILAYDAASNIWLPIFDGSDVGITKDVNAFTLLEDGTLLLSFNGPTTVPGLGAVDDSDIVQFIPTALGSRTAGSFAWYLHGADVGLTTDSEDIDALTFSTDGRLVISTIGNFSTASATGRDEDLFVLNNATIGKPSSGTWELFFDGSTVGLANEDINGAAIDPATGELYLTVKDTFAFAEQSIDANDIFICTLTPRDGGMTCAYRLFWDSDVHAYGADNLDGISFGSLPATYIASEQTVQQAADADAATDADNDDLYINDEETTEGTGENTGENETASNNRNFLPLVVQGAQ